MVDRTWAALPRRCRGLPPPVVIAESWLGDAGLRAHVANAPGGTLLVEGKTSDVFALPDGRRVKGQDWLTRRDWPWRQYLHWPGVRYARLTAINPTSGTVTVVIVEAPGRERYSLLGRDTTRSAPRVIRAWQRRSWRAPSFRTLKQLLATEACQVQTTDA